MEVAASHPVGTLLFDGDCGFCTVAAGRASRISPRVLVLPYQQADLDRLGVTASDAAEALQYVGARRRGSGADAIGWFLIDTGGAVRILGRLLLLPGVVQVARVVYRWVAANRTRLPGGTPACAVPTAPPTD